MKRQIKIASILFVILTLVLQLCVPAMANGTLINYADKSVFPNVQAFLSAKQSTGTNGVADTLVNPNSTATATSFGQVVTVLNNFESTSHKNSNSWFAIDLGAVRTVNSVEIYQYKNRIKAADVYATSLENIQAAQTRTCAPDGSTCGLIKTGNTTCGSCGFEVSDEVLAASTKVGSATFDHGDTDSTTLNASREELTTPSTITFASPVMTQYLLVVVTRPIAINKGMPVWQVKVMGETAPAESPALVNYADKAAYSSVELLGYHQTVGDTDVMIDSARYAAALGNTNSSGANNAKNATWSYGQSSTVHMASNVWFAVDLGTIRNISKLELVEFKSKLEKNRIFYTNDDSLWAEIVAYHNQHYVTDKQGWGLTETGKAPYRTRASASAEWPALTESATPAANTTFTGVGIIDRLTKICDWTVGTGTATNAWVNYGGVTEEKVQSVSFEPVNARYLVFVADRTYAGNSLMLWAFRVLGMSDSDLMFAAYKNGEGQEVLENAVAAGTALDYTVQLGNAASKAHKMGVITAQYKTDGTLLSVAMRAVYVAAGVAASFSDRITPAEAAKTVKVMAWDIDHMQPVDRNYTFTIQ